MGMTSAREPMASSLRSTSRSPAARSTSSKETGGRITNGTSSSRARRSSSRRTAKVSSFTSACPPFTDHPLASPSEGPRAAVVRRRLSPSDRAWISFRSRSSCWASAGCWRMRIKVDTWSRPGRPMTSRSTTRRPRPSGPGGSKEAPSRAWRRTADRIVATGGSDFRTRLWDVSQLASVGAIAATPGDPGEPRRARSLPSPSPGTASLVATGHIRT